MWTQFKNVFAARKYQSTLEYYFKDLSHKIMQDHFVFEVLDLKL